MPKVTGVRFKGNGKIYYFSPGELEINKGDGVIVETAQGTEYGDVLIAQKEVREEDVVLPLKSIIRVATEKDLKKLEDNVKKEKDAHSTCLKKIEKHKLDMHLVNVEYSFDGKKIVFSFTADGRVDFRELVKELASTFRTRIELRQIGVRDETKMKGGIGPCGREVCCATFMTGFHPVSIKMAKEQNISLNPTKISGLCGRLMCCLAHEYEVYRDIRPRLKRMGSTVMTPDGPGIVVDNLVLLEKCKVRVTFPGETIEIRKYPLDDVKAISKEDAQKQFERVRKMKPQEIVFNNPSETWDREEEKKSKDNNRNNNKNRRRRKKSNNSQQKNKNTQNSNNNNNSNNNRTVNVKNRNNNNQNNQKSSQGKNENKDKSKL